MCKRLVVDYERTCKTDGCEKLAEFRVGQSGYARSIRAWQIGKGHYCYNCCGDRVDFLNARDIAARRSA